MKGGLAAQHRQAMELFFGAGMKPRFYNYMLAHTFGSSLVVGGVAGIVVMILRIRSEGI